jgi:hypothetical protein
MEEIDRAEWDAAWRNAELRTVLAPGDLVIKTGLDTGRILSANISVVPHEYRSQIYIDSDECPLCKKLTREEDSVVAILHPTFEKLSGVSFGVRLHRECLESLPISDEPKPILW